VITTFDLIRVASTAGVGVAGYRIGQAVGGATGSYIGLALGIIVGWRVGRLPFLLTSRLLRRSLVRSTKAELRSRLEREYFVSNFIIAELVSRGEPPESFRWVIEAQLNSASSDVCQFGRRNAQLWFPELLENTINKR
jgi:hypothetical protein